MPTGLPHCGKAEPPGLGRGAGRRRAVSRASPGRSCGPGFRGARCGPPFRSGKILEIVQVLESPNCSLVRPEVGQADHMNFNLIENLADSCRVAVAEIEAGERWSTFRCAREAPPSGQRSLPSQTDQPTALGHRSQTPGAPPPAFQRSGGPCQPRHPGLPWHV
jgi:hypothetical protein